MNGKRIVIETPSRIHIGILDLKGDLGRYYGSVGLAVQKPHTRVVIEEAGSLIVEGEDSERGLYYAEKFLYNFNIKHRFKITIKNAIPMHVGLGSGTQLALAIGYGLAKLNDLDLELHDIASVMGRGKVSGSGIYTFRYGGFVVDGGRKIDREEIPPLIVRLNFPEEWKIIICIPNIERGLYGKAEEEAMAKAREKCLEKNVSNASRILLMKMLPALVNRDIEEFGRALLLFEKEVGLMFEDVQSGVFRDEIIDKGIHLMLEEGVYGAGQSSWGPAFYGITDKGNLHSVVNKLRRFLDYSVGGEVIITKANNVGAVIKNC